MRRVHKCNAAARRENEIPEVASVGPLIRGLDKEWSLGRNLRSSTGITATVCAPLSVKSSFV